MVLDQPAAALFIRQYMRVLGAVHRLSGAELVPDPIALLCAARRSLEEDPELLHRAADELAGNEEVPPEILRAVQGNRLRYWVYLRDTSRYSVFIDPKEREAFAVVGLTNRVRDILGGSAVAFRTGVVEFRGQYVCDGLLENHVWVGANYKREYAALLKELKEEGRMYARCEP
jgi:hypothetical protein